MSDCHDFAAETAAFGAAATIGNMAVVVAAAQPISLRRSVDERKI